MNAQYCIRCLHTVEHCTCPQGPRTQRHPTSCQCAMCETGRAVQSGTYVEESEESEESEE